MMSLTLEELIVSYQELGSVWKVGERHGICGQSVHERLAKAGVVRSINYFTEADKDRLRELYPSYKATNNLAELAKIMNRTKPFICRKAKELGLTTRFEAHTPASKYKLSIKASERIRKNGHPRWMKGKHHSDESKSKMSASSKRSWGNPNSNHRSEKEIQRRSDVMFRNRINGNINSRSNRTEINVSIGCKLYKFKSTWEYNFALVLDSIMSRGYISSWEYEPMRFVFHDIRRGIRSYLPDFMIITKSGDSIFFEVKGWKMEIGLKRIEMFKERYPNVKLYVIYESEYKKIISQADYILRYTK